ncbi:MAG TPA: M20/M25/M40 family metallo-hydrolase, partial [Bacteroidales bacterium]|nr:M20/M25/M40 family metallo-hydrolase [Bacteroidales bacterium]
MKEIDHNQVFSLLKQIVAIPSMSGEEELLSHFLQEWIESQGIAVKRKHSNLWCESMIHPGYPTILLNSHMDTVKPVAGWTMDPYLPEETGDLLYGLGVSDAGGSVVAMIFTFLNMVHDESRKFNLILLISAEEESSGEKGITSVIGELGKIDLAIVGEPTGLDMAVCERGLIVFDCYAHGKAGHVAHRNGENAILKAISDIERIGKLDLARTSEFLGDIQFEVTQIEGGYQHNVIPDTCKFVVDVRTNENYTNEEVAEILKNELDSEVKARSLRLRSSFIDTNHPLVLKARQLGIHTFGSKTMSDQALIPAPSVKLGPGNTELSHKADEYIEKVQ